MLAAPRVGVLGDARQFLRRHIPVRATESAAILASFESRQQQMGRLADSSLHFGERVPAMLGSQVPIPAVGHAVDIDVLAVRPDEALYRFFGNKPGEVWPDGVASPSFKNAFR